MTHLVIPFRTGGILSVAAIFASIVATKYVWAANTIRIKEKELGAYYPTIETVISPQVTTARDKFLDEIKRQQQEVKKEKASENAKPDKDDAADSNSKQEGKGTDKSLKQEDPKPVNIKKDAGKGENNAEGAKQGDDGQKKDGKKDPKEQAKQEKEDDNKGGKDAKQAKGVEEKDKKKKNDSTGMDKGKEKEGSGTMSQVSSFGGFLDSMTGQGRAKVISRRCPSEESQNNQDQSEGYMASIMAKLKTLGRSLKGGAVAEHTYEIEIESNKPHNKVIGTLVETIEMERHFSKKYPEFAFACQQGIKDVSESWFDRYMENLTDLCEDMRGDAKKVWSKILKKDPEDIEILIRGENGLEISAGKLNQVPGSDYSVEVSLSEHEEQGPKENQLTNQVSNALEEHRRRIRFAVSPQDKELLCLLQSAWASALKDYNEISTETCDGSPDKMPFTLKLQWKWNFVDSSK